MKKKFKSCTPCMISTVCLVSYLTSLSLFVQRHLNGASFSSGSFFLFFLPCPNGDNINSKAPQYHSHKISMRFVLNIEIIL